MTRYICNQCQQSYASPQSLWNHKKRCQNKRRSNLDAKLTGHHRYSTQHKNLRKGGNLSSDETLRKIMEILEGKMVDSEEDNEREDDDETSDKTINTENDTTPRDTAMFENVTLEDKERFLQLLSKLKKNNPTGDFEKIDELIPQYWNNEFKMNKDEWWNNRIGQVIGDKIMEELSAFKSDNMLTFLEMQIIMSFMEKKRLALNDLLHIMESKNGQNEMLEKEVNQGIITEAEKNELLNNLDTETIKSILSHRVFNISKM